MIRTEWGPDLQERYENKSRWQVTLSDGRTVYQVQDGGEDWKELRNYLLENSSIYIVKMFVGFRDNCCPLPDNAEGYFLRLGLLATYGWEKHSFIVGILKDGVLELEKYETPEMTFLGKETRSIDGAGESLITNRVGLS